MGKPPKVHEEPRISANALAQYMVSSETARLGILRRSKFHQAPVIVPYREVRLIIREFLSDGKRNVNRLIEAEKMFEQKSQNNSYSTFIKNDSENSIDVLHGIQRMANQLNAYKFLKSPKKQEKLIISDVQVSVHADLLIEAPIKGDKHMGAAILRMSQDNSDTEDAKSKRRTMGLYVATLIRMHIDNSLKKDLPVANRLCMSIDIQHGEAFQAPNSNTKRQKDIESACQMIASHWPNISSP